MILGQIRQRFGKVFIGGIIGFIAFVFVFYGVFSPKATRGLHEGSVAGTVNGDAISIPEFRREWTRKMEFFRKIFQGKVSEDQLKSFQVGEAVFKQLARQKIMLQQFQSEGLQISDAQVKETILEIPDFQKEGKFDLNTYKAILEANHQAPGAYEKFIRQMLSLQSWGSYFQNRLPVSVVEAKERFRMENEKRQVKYLLLTQKQFQEASFLPSLLKVWGSEKKLTDFLKPYGLQIKTSPSMSREQFQLTQIAVPQELKREVFQTQQVSCQEPKQYPVEEKKLLICVSKVEMADFSKWDQKQEIKKLALHKAQAFLDRWSELLLSRARIQKNEAVLDSF